MLLINMSKEINVHILCILVSKLTFKKFFYKRDSILYIRKQLIVGNPMLYYLLMKASSRYSGRCHGFGIEMSLAQLLRNSQCKKPV